MERIAIWDTTGKCNLRCEHCYNQERYWEKASDYKELSVLQIDNMVQKLSRLGFSRLHLLGGEPLLSPNLLEFVRAGKKCNMTVSMVTNGILLTAKRMKEICEAGVTSISISLDGTTAEVNDSIRGIGSFEKVIENIQQIVLVRDNYNKHKDNREKVYIGISFTLSAKNCSTSGNLVSFVKNLDLDGVNISYLSEEGQARSNYNLFSLKEEEKVNFLDRIVTESKEYRDIEINIDSRGCLGEYLYKRHGIKIKSAKKECAGGDGQFYILADGTLLPCSPVGTSIGSTISEKHLKGLIPPNLLRDSVESITKSEYLVSFYNYVHSFETYKKINPCCRCKYNCLPCPLLYGDKNCDIKECVYALERIGIVDQKLLNSVTRKKPYLRISQKEQSVEIFSFLSGEEYLLADTGYLIWEQIDNVKTVNEIVMYIFEKVKAKKSIEEVQKDILDFLYEIRMLGIIEDPFEESSN